MIAPETIAEVKDRTDLVALIGENVRLTRRGRSFVGLCPFHKEKSPSFHVNPERGFFHCFGCKESGSAVDYLMKVHGLPFPDAVRELAQRAGIVLEEHAGGSEADRRAEQARRDKEQLFDVNQLAATYFERMLGLSGIEHRHPLADLAIDELVRRGMPKTTIDHPESDPSGEASRWREALQVFRIGYAPFGWDGLTSYFRAQGISPVAAEKLGLSVARSGGSGQYDRFRHRLMFSVIDVMGRVVAFSGRALEEPDEARVQSLGISGPRRDRDDDRAPPKYINSPESPIYTKGEHLFGLYQARQTLRQDGSAVLVEGNFDVFALHARGEKRAVAPLGTAFTDGQASLLKRYAPQAIMAFDGDSAGRKATRAARGATKAGGLEARVAVLPPGSDPDTFAREHGIDALGRLLSAARGMIDYLIDDALNGEGFRGASLSEQMARARAVTKLLSEEDDPNLRQMSKLYADQLASRLLVAGRSPTDLHQLEGLVEQATRRPATAEERGPRTSLAGPRGRSRVNYEQMEKSIVGAILDFPVLVQDSAVVETLGRLEGDLALAIAILADAKPGENTIYSPEFLAQLPDSIHSFAVGRLAAPEFETLEAAKTELMANAKKLENRSNKRQQVGLIEKLGSTAGDVDSETALLQQVLLNSRKKRGLD